MIVPKGQTSKDRHKNYSQVVGIFIVFRLSILRLNLYKILGFLGMEPLSAGLSRTFNKKLTLKS